MHGKPSGDERGPLHTGAGPGGSHILVEQLGELLHHSAAQFLRIHDRHGPAVNTG